MLLLRKQSFLFLTWIFLAFTNFGSEASCASTPGNTFNYAVYSSNGCSGLSATKGTVLDKNCSKIDSGLYIFSDCTSGTFTIYDYPSCIESESIKSFCTAAGCSNFLSQSIFGKCATLK